ncbi:MAG: trypsin-like peptidase domain-containing protein [Candidatus Kerfeldbacteria bacterium]|nr:trypsin-like peptidase domain-containing protein [Candidatus Kerfeldbacteria bacterium]
MTPPNDSLKKTGIGTIVFISFLVGALSGGLFGTLAAGGGLKNLLGRTTKTATSVNSVNLGTLRVQEDSATVEVVKKVSPAVVSIIAKKDFSKVFGNEDQSTPLDLFGLPFFQQPQPQGKRQVGSGSGFIVSSDGLILTNKHVATIEGADEFTVIMNNQKNYDAKVVATDPSTDIAVMKIEAKDLPTVELGNSDDIQTGDTVIAIGNVLGQYRNSVTKGIVSGLARTIKAGDGSGNVETLRNVIQTDAAINYGNSGGPLLNLAGQAIGINTAIDSEGQLIGFALPINIAKSDLDSLKKTGKIERPYLGVRYVIINEQVKQANELTVDYGALVLRGSSQNQLAVIPGSPADKAGIAENDIILELDGRKISDDYDLAQALFDKKIGDTVTLKILSKGKEKTAQVKLEVRPAE